MVQVGKDITWQDSLILENEVSVLNNVLYGDLIDVWQHGTNQNGVAVIIEGTVIN